MLFVSWQLRTAVCAIFLASCLGHELVRVRDRNYFNEQRIIEQSDKKYLKREQPRLRINAQNLNNEASNRILENDEDNRISQKYLSDPRIKRRVATDVTRHLNVRLDESHECLKQPIRDQYQDLRSRQEYKTPFDNRHNEKCLNRSRGKNVLILKPLTHTRGRISARYSKNSRKERREYSRLEDKSYLSRRQFPSNRQNALQRIDDQNESKTLDNIRDGTRKSERTQRQNTNEVEESSRHLILRRRILPTNQQGNNNNRKPTATLRQIENNKTTILSECISEQNEREPEHRHAENKHKVNVSQESGIKMRPFINQLKTHKIHRNSYYLESNRRKFFVFLKRFGNLKDQYDASHLQQYLSRANIYESTVQVDSKRILKDMHTEHIETLRGQENLENVRMRQCKQHPVEGYINHKSQNNANKCSIYQNDSSTRVNKDGKLKIVRINKRLEERNAENRFSQLYGNQLLERNTRITIMPETIVNYYKNTHYAAERNLQKPTALRYNAFLVLEQVVFFTYIFMKAKEGENDSKIHLPFKVRKTLKITG